MFIFCIVIDLLINSNFIGLILQIFVGAFVYTICLLLLKDSFLNELIVKYINPFLKKMKIIK